MTQDFSSDSDLNDDLVSTPATPFEKTDAFLLDEDFPLLGLSDDDMPDDGGAHDKLETDIMEDPFEGLITKPSQSISFPTQSDAALFEYFGSGWFITVTIP